MPVLEEIVATKTAGGVSVAHGGAGSPTVIRASLYTTNGAELLRALRDDGFVLASDRGNASSRKTSAAEYRIHEQVMPEGTANTLDTISAARSGNAVVITHDGAGSPTAIPYPMHLTNAARVYAWLKRDGCTLSADRGANSARQSRAIAQLIQEQLEAAVVFDAAGSITTAGGTDAVPAVGTLAGYFPVSKSVSVAITSVAAGAITVTVPVPYNCIASVMASTVAGAVNAETGVSATASGDTVRILASGAADTITLTTFEVV